jgi:CheY-like chemotaxis protein
MAKDRLAPGKKVLVIEDDADVALALKTLLQGPGVAVLCAENGPAGIAMATEMKPDLALIDIHLPGMNGLEVIRTLRLTPGLETLPIIVITGDSTIEYIRETARLKVTDFLVKANVLSGAGLDRIEKALQAGTDSPKKKKLSSK